MNKAFFYCICLFFVFFLAHNIFAQSSKDSLAAFPFIRFQYSYLLPSGDFEDTYGNTNAIGAALGFKTRSNWQFEMEGSFMFGADIKRKDLLDGIINREGDVTDADGELIKVLTEIRAMSFYASVGKVFPLLGSNKNSGILIQGGFGYLQHQIKVDYRDGEVFQFSDEMLKGYDRLHTGIALRQFIGFQYFGRNNLGNFYLGIEFNQGFTRNRREYNYDTRSFDKNLKTDGLTGFRFGWAIPMRKRTADEFYYY